MSIFAGVGGKSVYLENCTLCYLLQKAAKKKRYSLFRVPNMKKIEKLLILVALPIIQNLSFGQHVSIALNDWFLCMQWRLYQKALDLINIFPLTT